MATIKRGRTTGNMLRAQEQGTDAQQRATQGYTQQIAQGQQQGMQAGQMIAGLYNQDQARQEQERSNKAREDLTARGQDIQMASQGLQENPRYRQLQEEMQRGAAQADKPLEDIGPRVIPTEQGLKKQAAEQALTEKKAETERIRAEAYSRQVDQIRQARAGISSGKSSVAEVRALKDNLMRPMESKSDLLNRAMKGLGESKPGDWNRIAEMASGVPDPELQASIEAKQMTPRVRDFIERNIAIDAMTFIASTGDLPDSDVVDFTSPAMQIFTAQAQAAQQSMVMMGPGFQQFANITSLQEKIRFINQVAALQTFQKLAVGDFNQGGEVQEGFVGAQPGAPAPGQTGQPQQGPQEMIGQPRQPQPPGQGPQPQSYNQAEGRVVPKQFGSTFRR